MVLCEGDAWIYTSWVMLVVAVNLFFNSRTPVNFVYHHIKKPSWSPPNWMFPVVWICLYVLMGISAATIHLSGGWAGNVLELVVFLVLVVALALWSIIFADLQLFFLAFLWQLVILGLSIAVFVLFLLNDSLAGWLSFPLVVWVAFATLLMLYVWRCNVCWQVKRHDFTAVLVCGQNQSGMDADQGFMSSAPMMPVGSSLFDAVDVTRLSLTGQNSKIK